jgi:hypothetical protein
MIVSNFCFTLKYVRSTGFDRSALCPRSQYAWVRCWRWAQRRGHAAGCLGLAGCASGQGWPPSFRIVCASHTGLHLSPCRPVASELGRSSHLPLLAFFCLPSSLAHWLALSRCYSLTRPLPLPLSLLPTCTLAMAAATSSCCRYRSHRSNHLHALLLAPRASPRPRSHATNTYQVRATRRPGRRIAERHAPPLFASRTHAPRPLRPAPA